MQSGVGAASPHDLLLPYALGFLRRSMPRRVRGGFRRQLGGNADGLEVLRLRDERLRLRCARRPHALLGGRGIRALGHLSLDTCLRGLESSGDGEATGGGGRVEGGAERVIEGHIDRRLRPRRIRLCARPAAEEVVDCCCGDGSTWPEGVNCNLGARGSVIVGLATNGP